MDCSWTNPNGENQRKGLENIPKLVFCKDCSYWHQTNHICKLHDNAYTGYRQFNPNDFCSKGVIKSNRKED